MKKLSSLFLLIAISSQALAQFSPEAVKMMSKPPQMVEERALKLWTSALDQAEKGKTREAAASLQTLLDGNQDFISKDLILLTVGRMMYQDSKFEMAIKYFNMVPKDSDYWLEALEERAHTNAKQKKYDQVLADLKTLRTPFLSSQIGPEPYLLNGIIYLKICDYASIFKLLKEFKERFKARATALQDLEKSGNSPAINNAIAKLEKGPASFASFGEDGHKLPRLINRDRAFIAAVEKQKVTRIKSPVFARAKELAAQDVKELSRILTKLQVLEVEAYQRMHVNQRFADARKKELQRNEIQFKEEDEEWLDELTGYQVEAKECQEMTAKGKSL